MKFKERTEEIKPDLTPMIDIIFQLLIFFVLTAKFIAFEGQLQAYLPKDRGTAAGNPVLTQDVRIYLGWDEEGKVVCQTTNYEFNGEARQQYTFPFDSNAQQIGNGWVTKTVLRNAKGEGRVEYPYAAPDFFQVEEYMKYRRDTFQGQGQSSKGLPVEVTFDSKVPWQAVVNVIDICTRLGITNIALTAEELDYDS